MKKSELINVIKEETRKLLKEDINDTPIHKFVYFSLNYPSSWLEDIWGKRTVQLKLNKIT